MENLTPRPQTSALDMAAETNETFQDGSPAPEAFGEQTSLPASGLPDLAEAIADGATTTPDEAALTPTSDIAEIASDEQVLPPSSDDNFVAAPTDEDSAPTPTDGSQFTDQSIQPQAEDVATAARPSPKKRGRPPKKRALPNLPQRASDRTVVEDCIAKLMKLNGRDLHTDMERGHVLNTLQASCADGAEFAKVVRKRARLSGKQALNLINLTARFGAQVDRWAALGVTSTHLRHLVTKPDEYVEKCYAAFSATGAPSTAAFSKKVMADFGSARPEGDLRAERRAFLKAAARKAADDNLAAFLPPLEELAKVLVAGLQTGRDGAIRIRKPDLAKSVALPARTACRIFEGFLTRMVPQDSFNGLQYYDRVTVLIPELQALRIVLAQLSSLERWPKHAGVEWITGTVLPMVRWAIGAESDTEPPLDAILDQGSEDFVICNTLPKDFSDKRRSQAQARREGIPDTNPSKTENPSKGPGDDAQAA